MHEQTPIQGKLANMMGGKFSRRVVLRRAAALGVSAPVIGVLLAACGGGDSTPAPSGGSTATQAPSGGSTATATQAPSGGSTATATASATEAPATSAPSGGDVPEQVVIMQGVDANTLDPLLRNSTPEFNINAHIFDMWLNRDPKTLEIGPGIITKWGAVDDTTWEFTIAEGATFHNGDPVNAEAAIFSMERAARPKIGEKPPVQNIASQIGFVSAEKIDEHSIRVKTSKPAAIYPDLLTSHEMCPPSVYDDNSTDNVAKVGANPVGSGPYKLIEWVKDDHIRLERFDDYWGDKPKIKTVIFRPVPELSSRVVALQNGEANIIVNVAPDMVADMNKGENTRVSQVTGGRIIFLGIRCDKPPFDNPKVRQALNYAIDFDSINTALLADSGERAPTIVNPPHQNTNLKAYPYDPEKAKALLKEAGVAEGFEFTMDAPSGRYIKDAEMAQAIGQMFEDIGFKVNLRVLEWSVYAGQILQAPGNTDEVFFLGLGAPFSGEQEIFFVHPDYSLNFTRWQNDDYVAKFKELNSIIDVDKRQALMDELQEIIMEDCPWVPIWHQVDFYGVTKSLPWEARPDERVVVSHVGL